MLSPPHYEVVSDRDSQKDWESRTWDKCVAEMGYTLRGLHSFISALRVVYRAQRPPSIIGSSDGASGAFYFNLCDRDLLNAAKQSIAKVG